MYGCGTEKNTAAAPSCNLISLKSPASCHSVVIPTQQSNLLYLQQGYVWVLQNGLGWTVVWDR